MVYNCGRSVCLSVCQMITFENFDVGSSYFKNTGYLQGIRVKLVYEGYLVKVKVTRGNHVVCVYIEFTAVTDRMV